MKDIHIVPASLEYAEQFRDCLDEVAREKIYLIFLEAPALEQVTTFLQKLIDKQNPQFFSLHDNQVIGWCDIVRESHPTKSHVAKLGIGIRKAFRGKGLGRRLLERTLEEAKKVGIEKVELGTVLTNSTAITLYEKLGFTVEGTRKKFRKVDDSYQDELLMSLFL